MDRNPPHAVAQWLREFSTQDMIVISFHWKQNTFSVCSFTCSIYLDRLPRCFFYQLDPLFYGVTRQQSHQYEFGRLKAQKSLSYGPEKKSLVTPYKRRAVFRLHLSAANPLRTSWRSPNRPRTQHKTPWCLLPKQFSTGCYLSNEIFSLKTRRWSVSDLPFTSWRISCLG